MGRIVQPARSDRKGSRKADEDSEPAAKVHTIKVEETGQVPLVDVTSP